MIDVSKAILRTLKNEDSSLKGKVTTDSGGVTRWGISQKAYPTLDIKNLSLEAAIRIYQRDYWAKLKFDDLKSQLIGEAVYDLAVNAGVKQAILLAQRAAMMSSDFGVKVDGKPGPDTVRVLNMQNEKSWIINFTQLRIDFYTKLSESDPDKYSKYLNGWLTRAKGYLK